jgi:hypothetical protein
MLCYVALVRTDVSEERLHHQGEKTVTLEVFLHRVSQLPVTANAVPYSPILVTLMMEALHSSETSLLTRASWYTIPEDCILSNEI